MLYFDLILLCQCPVNSKMMIFLFLIGSALMMHDLKKIIHKLFVGLLI